MSITIIPFGPADETAIEQAWRIGSASVAADLPDFPPLCRQRFTGRVCHPMPGIAPINLLAHLDGEPAGYLVLELPQLENTENASADLIVHPAYRRRGVGRALHEHGLAVLREQGRKVLSTMSVVHLPGEPDRPSPAIAFAATVGAVDALPDVRRRLHTADLDQVKLDSLLAGARSRAAGYEVLFWRGRTPDEFAADVAYLDGRLLADAPMGDLAWEPEQVDAERLRATDLALEARGRRLYHVGVRHQASGRLVAWTLLDVGASAGWHAFQQITIVDPEHRGHRLGLLSKIENLRHLLGHEPAVRVIDTFNAASNDHMITINEQLGFRAIDRWSNWQLNL
ncbi:Acetyltransferase (GNAT) family protein [Micromonospora phaseoli]|uniref:Acetyltransferase (GNAT) family protein n=1 Tax=Micromonospora phaseoli TaxID=1144548 RepID=A0A1H7DHF3_9ACTN|nr:GNAT family N-acetyltransferase [Micromonospora phaseoli]PZW02330.1 acetyltransferase (GNAT) family protein [Micromonospora phaseoli]GIJ75668.1 GNAT family N-acetyltransferase [Micromonospora phaseoli]SEK01229.1 Acetyltransferase (GNAT) family protein [Micromonospora phaseoli]